MTASGRYIFCDIDGTLLYAKGAGRIAFAEAFREAYGKTVEMAHISFAGATDIRVLEQLAHENDVQLQPEKTRIFFERLPVHLDDNMGHFPLTVFPGVNDFLDRVSAHWKLGLVSGNIRACAFVKLRRAGLDQYFDGGIGGFGDDDGDRRLMAALALERAGHPERAFLLGDTPSDIDAARANKMISVAVCNGQYDRTALESENPDILLDSFEQAEHLFEALEV